MSPFFLLLFLWISLAQECDPWTYKDCDIVWPKCWRTCDVHYYPLQDPVDIVNEAHDNTLGPAVFVFPDLDNVTLRHSDYTLSVLFPPGYSGGFTVNGMKYILQEFHFHTPAENNLSILGDGLGELDMEIHMVHKSYNSTNGTKTAILSLLWQKDGYTHPWLNQILQNLPSIPHRNQSTKINLTDISSLFEDQEKDFGYWTADGTLTTPPCVGGVIWYIMQIPLKCSGDQWKQFHDFTGTNARPVQRKIIARAYIPQKSHPAPVVIGIVIGLIVVMSVVISGAALYWHKRRRVTLGIDKPTYEKL